MNRSRSICGLLGGLAILVTLPRTVEAACSDSDKTAVFVQGKTPLHRGPGLNYGVASFLELGRCMKMSQTSVDKKWVLVTDGKMFGWVSVERLDAKSLMSAQEEKSPEVGPVGSGQTRGLVTTTRKARLFEQASQQAKVRRRLEKGTKLVALSITGDKTLIEVRTERGGETGWVKRSSIEDSSGVLASLPILDGKLETGLVEKDPKKDSGVVQSDPAAKKEPVAKKDPAKKDPAKKDPAAKKGSAPVAKNDPPIGPDEEEKPPVITDELSPDRNDEGGGPTFDVRLLGVALLPSHRLGSTGTSGIRRYNIAAYTGGARVEGIIDGLGPLRLRLGYAFAPMPGIRPKGASAPKIFGHSHDARVTAGIPIQLGMLRLVPEVGYAFSLFDIRPALPGGPPQFFSSLTHVATPGLAATIAASKSVDINLEAAALLGYTLEQPFDLGKPGVTAGVQAAAGVGFYMGDVAMLIVQYEFRFFRAFFSGASGLDPSITKANLDTLEHGLSLGVALVF